MLMFCGVLCFCAASPTWSGSGRWLRLKHHEINLQKRRVEKSCDGVRQKI